MFYIPGEIGRLEPLLYARRQAIEDWFNQTCDASFVPFYSSHDIRDSGFKASCIDANLYPGGFHHIGASAQSHAAEYIHQNIQQYLPGTRTVCLLIE